MKKKSKIVRPASEVIIRKLMNHGPPLRQGCQIFLDAIYQNGGKINRITTKFPNP
jgi:hypothetical protein